MPKYSPIVFADRLEVIKDGNTANFKSVVESSAISKSLILNLLFIHLVKKSSAAMFVFTPVKCKKLLASNETSREEMMLCLSE